MNDQAATYQDENSPEQIPCDLSLKGDSLHIYLLDESKRLLVWNARRLHSCKYEYGVLQAKFGAHPYRSITCQGEMAKAIYDVWTGKAPQLKHRMSRRGRITLVGIACFAIVITVLIFTVIMPWVGSKAASLVPVDMEISLGEKISESMLVGNETDEETNRLLQEFTEQIDFGTAYPLKVRVLVSPEINAFALPGGQIFVYSSIIRKMKSYEELAALLSHEVTHVEKRHSLKSICRSAASGLFIAAFFGDVNGIASGILSQADQFRQLQYSRELETESDLEGLAIMERNHIDPNGMRDLLLLLKEESDENPGMMKYLSTHPETGERISAVESRLGKSQGSAHPELEALFEKIQSSLEPGAKTTGY